MGRNAGWVVCLGFLEYFEDLPGMEGREGVDGVPVDLKVSVVAVVVVVVMILSAELKRLRRRSSSSISCWVRSWRMNFWALALFHRENRTSVAGRWWWWVGFGGANIGN